MRRTLTVLFLVAVFTGAAPLSANAGPGDDSRLSETTAVGVHNAYQKDRYAYLADVLDAGAGLVEIDVWTDSVFHKWRVSHDLPFFRSNDNCASSGLRAGSRDQDLDVCLANIRDWHTAHPGHPPLVVKVEMKNGFDGRSGLGAGELDRLIAQKLGGIVYKPADLMTRTGGDTFADLDAAARANNWPSRSQLAGRVLFEIVPGTFEQGNPLDRYWTDVEYADHLRSLQQAGRIGEAMVFPAVLGAAAGDPRTRYADAGRRPWFVVFDGAATAYLGGGIDPAWYDQGHYLLVMTGAHEVAPAIDARNPTTEQARARIAQLAAAHASILTSDWTPSTGVLSDVVHRG